VALMRAVREAMEGSVQVHFNAGGAGTLINCMSVSNDVVYQSNACPVMRTSDDFWPNKPESHSQHLIVNAYSGLWFGEFIHPDWDMFQSGHAAGGFHAAGRAVSGSPVYVSDKPGTTNMDVLRRLVFSDGRIARCERPGRPTRQSLFDDPTTGSAPLAIVNDTPAGHVVGVFNARYTPPGTNAAPVRQRLHVTPDLIPGADAGMTAIFWCAVAARASTDAPMLELDELGYEVVTIAPLIDGVAVIGLEALFAPGAGIASRHGRTIEVRDAGTLLVWSASPLLETQDASVLTITHDGALHRIRVPRAGLVDLDRASV
jgi:raffinose synthase